MPRQARLDVPGALHHGALHHIMIRGINKSDIFKNGQDNTLLVERLGEGMAMGKISEFTRGGLIRSRGGWSQVVSARRRGQREESDERILGSGDFVNAILKEAEEKTRRQLRLRRTDKTLIKIIEEECKEGRSSANELKGGSRRRKVSTLRARIAKRGVEELGLSMAEIARHVGVTTSSIAKAVARLEEEGG